MHILLFIFYSLLSAYGILKIPFIRKSGIRPVWLLIFFAAHVLLGCLHTIIAWRFFPGHGDLWDFFERSLVARRQMTADIHAFITYNANWNYFTHNNIIWVHVLLNFLSRNNIYINTLLFSFPVFLGNIALFRVFRRRFPNDPLTALSVLIFPSTLFWTACIHREGAIYGLLGFLFYYMDWLLSASHPRRTRWALYCVLLFIGVIYFRPAIILTLLPALLIWILFEKLPYRKALFITGSLVAALLLLTFITPGLFAPLLQSLSDRQKEFQILEGGSKLYLPILEPSGESLLHTLPAALRNGFFEPLPGSGGQKIYLVFSAELLLVWVLIVYALIIRVIRPNSSSPVHPIPHFPPSSPSSPSFSIACLVFALPGLVLVGLIVPFGGAIVRYRSLFLPFLLAPFLHSLRSTGLLKKLNAYLYTNILTPP